MLLAPLEQRQLLAAVEQVRVLVAAGRGGDQALRPARGRRVRSSTAPDDLVGDEAHRPQGVELAEVVAVAGQQALGDELQQDGVVALERREDVGVGLELRQPVLGR